MVQDYDICVCVNNGGTKDMATPDMYVNAAPYVGPDCMINISVWDDHNNRYSAKEFPCDRGHDTGDPAGPFTAPMTVHAYVRLDLRNKPYWVGDSPPRRIGG